MAGADSYSRKDTAAKLAPSVPVPAPLPDDRPDLKEIEEELYDYWRQVEDWTGEN